MTMPNDEVSTSSAGSPAVGEKDQQSGGGGARAQIRDVKDKVVEEARSSIRQARDSASSSFDQSRNRAADSIDSIASAVRGTGDRLRSDNQATAANLSDSLAGQVERVSSYLRTRDLSGVREDLERFARQQPTVAIGVALAVGMLGARFLKSSPRRGGGASPRGDGGSDFEIDTGRRGYRQDVLPAGGSYGGA
jgi:ElaB/YqjD/DUF883 family membrane-anchored ribosome-binding protein